MYRVTPRYLAGDDNVLAEEISTTLTEANWASWTVARGSGDTTRSALLHLSRDTLRGAEWILADYPFLLGGLPVAWQVSARTSADSVMPHWNAYFTTGTPHEALTAFLLALDARTEPTAGDDTPETVLIALIDQGWSRDIDHPTTTANDPHLTASFTFCLLPPLIQDADPHPEPVGWQAWAEPHYGAPYQWCATFSTSVPNDLVATFATALASPLPVRRHALPENAEGLLTIHLSI